MRKWLLLMIAAFTTAGCGGGGGGAAVAVPGPTGVCTATEEKQFVLDQMRDVYFWNDLLPANVNIGQYATAEDLLAFLTSFQPIDRFSFINSADADAAFFGEGKFAGFGFSYRFEGANEPRFTRVYSDSPAATAGFERGQTLLEIDGQTIAALGGSAGIRNALGPSETGISRTFKIRRLDGSEFDVTATKAVVTIDPVPQFRVINTGGSNVGYLELATFISTAEAPLASAFQAFQNAGVSDVIVDLRYNGGGLVSVAESMGDLLGGDVADGLVYSKTLFNDNNSQSNSIRNFVRRAQSMNLSRLVVIATGGTASASELVINGLEPHAEVTIVGATTFGKPVGQVGLQFCDKILRPTAFETVNSLDQGQYFDGLPVDCAAADDLNAAVGATGDPSFDTALGFLASGSCPVLSLNALQKIQATKPVIGGGDNAAEIYAGAY